MKFFLASAALFATALAQTSLADLPQCGRLCINNMLGQSTALGCPPKNGQPDAVCLCADPRFGFGVRDCVIQACPSGTDTNSIISYGLSYCAAVASSPTPSAGAATSALTQTGTATGPGKPGITTTGTGAPSGVAGGIVVTTITSGDETITSTISGGAGGSTPITTIPVLKTVTSDGKVETSTIGSSTLYSPVGGIVGGGNSTATSISQSASSVVTSLMSSASEAEASATSSASSLASSVSSGASDAVSSATSAAGSATSSAAPGAAPTMHIALNGLAGVAGLAVVLAL